MKNTILGFLWSLVAILLLIFSMPPFGFWPLAPIGFAVMILAQYRIFPPRVHWLAPSLFMSGFITVMFSDNYGFSFSQIVQFYPVIFVILMVLGWFFSKKSLNKAIITNNRYLALEAALLWVAFDFIRISFSMFGTVGFIGYSFYKFPWLIQPISILGIYGLNFVIVLFGCSLGMLLIKLYDYRIHPTKDLSWIDAPSKFWIILSSSLLCFWFLSSIILFTVQEKNDLVKVAAICPNTTDTAKLVEMTKEAAVMGAKVVVWPEGSFIVGNIKDDTKGKFVRDLAKEQDIYLVVVNFIEMGYKGTRNEVILIDPQGEVVGISGKDHPLRLLSESRSTKPTSKAFETEFGKVGTVISYDQMFIDTLRNAAKNGVGLVFAPANEWESNAKINPAYTIFRAVENNISIVKADTWYNTLFVNPKGEIIAFSQVNKGDSAAITVSNIPMGKANTVQKKAGDWFGWVCLIGVFTLPIVKKVIK